MAFKMKLFIMAGILLLGVTGVAFASGQVPGAVSGGIGSLTGSSVGGTSGVSSEYGEDNAAGDEYGNDEATEVEDDDSAVSDEYGDDDATEQEDHGRARHDDDEAGEMNEHHQGNMGRGRRACQRTCERVKELLPCPAATLRRMRRMTKVAIPWAAARRIPRQSAAMFLPRDLTATVGINAG